MPIIRGDPTIFSSRKARWATGIAAGCLVVAGAGLAVAYQQFGAFDQVDFDPMGAREALEARDADADLAEEANANDEHEVPDVDYSIEIERQDGLLTTLILGSDAIPGEESARADAIMLVVVPPDDEPIITSIPRDLWVHNPCTGGMTRINAGLNGCGDDISGPDLMTIMVEDLAGIEIDHYAEIEFDGFVRIIDTFGGVEICTDHPVRDRDAHLEMPGGCIQAGGDDALAWARSRKTQELVDGVWRTQPDASTRTRDARQQDLLLSVVERIAGFESLGKLASTVHGLQDSVRLDSGLSMTRAVSLAWDNRDIDTGEVVRIELPVSSYTTSGGAQVMRLEGSLREMLADALDKSESELAVVDD